MSYTSDTLTIEQDVTAEEELQFVDVLTPKLFGPSQHNRKDSHIVKIEADTGGDPLTLLCYISTQDFPLSLGTVTLDGLQEYFIDISAICGITKWWQFRFVGQSSNFKLTCLTIEYTARPEPTSYYQHLLHETGVSKKRIRVWPVTIDTLGDEVSIVPYVDGVVRDELVVTSTYPKTFYYQFTDDVFGVDYSLVLHGCCDFELYKIHDPQGVQVLPVAKRFDQVGSTEFFRYGKIKAFIIRLIAFGGTSIPFTLYFADTSTYTGSITVVSGKEDTFEVGVPKTVAGQIMRLELGPTDFDFHRFYVHVQVIKSGKDTEAEWIGLE